jgi:hypothetical protein
VGGLTGNEWQPAPAQQAEQARQQVQRDPASFAQLLQAAPQILAGLEQRFTPEQIGQVFGEIGFSRKEQNPPPPDDSGTLKVEQQPQQPVFGMAEGGYVDAPGYYAAGGLGLSAMRSHGTQAHYSGSNIKPAIKPPGVHLINSNVPGRNDRIPMQARPGSFVLPADVVSGLGQGNTMAGAKMWGDAISSSVGPMGIQNVLRRRAIKAPVMPRSMSMGKSGSRGFAEGGSMDDHELTPIVVAGGECLVDPEYVCELGGGDPELGKKHLSNSVMTVRNHVIKHLKSLPRPVK